MNIIFFSLNLLNINILYKILFSLRLSLLRKMLRKITNIFDSNLICDLFQLFFSTIKTFFQSHESLSSPSLRNHHCFHTK